MKVINFHKRLVKKGIRPDIDEEEYFFYIISSRMVELFKPEREKPMTWWAKE